MKEHLNSINLEKIAESLPFPKHTLIGKLATNETPGSHICAYSEAYPKKQDWLKPKHNWIEPPCYWKWGYLDNKGNMPKVLCVSKDPYDHIFYLEFDGNNYFWELQPPQPKIPKLSRDGRSGND